MRARILEAGRNRWAVVALVAPGLWLAPAVSQAQNQKRGGGDEPALFATLRLYEVQEGTDLRGREGSPALRVANAALVGSATGAICAATSMPPQDPCPFDTTAVSHVPLSKGFGELSGDFQLLFDSMPDQRLLSDLVLVANGSVQGTLDLRPILFNNQPIATMEGTWKSKKLGVKGTFTGTFFVPVRDPAGACATGYVYVDLSSGSPVFQCLEPNEMSLGNPVTKVIATFWKTGNMDAHDKDDN
jgi:hypothetical protein